MTKNEKLIQMRNAIDHIEGSLMGLGDFIDIPKIFDGCSNETIITPKLKLGEIRRVCEALKECTRIINSEKYNI